MRILVINPRLIRLGALGACEQDRLTNVHDLMRLGHTVRLLTLGGMSRSLAEHEAYYQTTGIDATVVQVQHQRLHPARSRDLALLDGAAWEYAEPYVRRAVSAEIATWKPQLVWCHASYLWGPAAQAHQYGIPTVVRSVNYEATHTIQEDGKTLANWVRFIGKSLGERNAVHAASVLAAITPDEQKIYQRIAPAAEVAVLPLRALPKLLRPPHPVKDRQPLHVFMMGATYKVSHNRAALDFVLNQVIPRVRAQAPGVFIFHVLGGKVPDEVRPMAAPDLVFDGFVEDLEAYIAGMDIALSPSMYGQGMQQKVFEPLCRGLPTVTHRRALAGYPFVDGDEVMAAEHTEDFVAKLLQLRDPVLRAALSANVNAKAHQLFAQERMDERVTHILERARRITK